MSNGTRSTRQSQSQSRSALYAGWPSASVCDNKLHVRNATNAREHRRVDLESVWVGPDQRAAHEPRPVGQKGHEQSGPPLPFSTEDADKQLGCLLCSSGMSLQEVRERRRRFSRPSHLEQVGGARQHGVLRPRKPRVQKVSSLAE